MKILKDKNCKYFVSFEAVGGYDIEEHPKTSEELPKDIENLEGQKDIKEVKEDQGTYDESASVEADSDKSLSKTEINNTSSTQIGAQNRYVIKTVNISEIRLDDLVEYIYKVLEPNNDLDSPVVRETFCAFNVEQQKAIATAMLIDRYCINRILTQNKIYKTENWMYRTINDYYGQEVDMICLKPHVAEIVDSQLNSLKFKSLAKKLEYILQLEYGHLIPSVVNRGWYIVQTNVKELLFSNVHHFKECQKKDFRYLKNYKLPRAIVTQQPDGRYKVVDGYHRICAAGTDPFLVIYCSHQPTY